MTETTQPAATPKKRANSAAIFTVQDGKLTWDYGPLGKAVFDPNKASAENRARAMLHGFKQRIGDKAALEADPATGKTSPAEKLAKQLQIIEHLESGSTDWNMKAGGGGGNVSYVTRALVRLGVYSGTDVSDPTKALAFIKSLADSPHPKIVALGFKGQTGKVRDWLERSTKIAEAIEAIKAEERASAPAVDPDALLEEIEEASE